MKSFSQYIQESIPDRFFKSQNFAHKFFVKGNQELHIALPKKKYDAKTTVYAEKFVDGKQTWSRNWKYKQYKEFLQDYLDDGYKEVFYEKD